MTDLSKIAVVMGGTSSEREVSLKTGHGVLSALQNAGFCAVGLDLTADIFAFIQTIQTEKPTVIFNALHGKFGEDGCIQGLFNLMHIPYTHSGVLASALAMNKSKMKQFVQTVGVQTPPSIYLSQQNIRTAVPFDFPYVVKPNDGGSSIGVFIVRSQADKDAMLPLLQPDTSYLVEKYIPGRELSVMVTDDGPTGIVELIPVSGFYDFKNKYADNATHHVIPAPLPVQDTTHLMEQAFLIHKMTGCKGVSRSDFRYDDVTDKTHPTAYFLELNTNPGMTQLSLVPDIAKSVGISYTDLIVKLLKEASCEN